jgi:glycosyltransferase involved in cell wall biosynthesis
MDNPFVSVVTPFHNTAPYLAQCIESVLKQTYCPFEYILVDNCSNDGSTEIAESYARRDSRIRFVRRSQLLTQVQNYNTALAEISAESRYCKIVQADDFIFPECLERMVEVFESSESVGLVSSYWLKGNELRGTGYPYPAPIMPGKDMARLYLRTGLWVFGSPTAVMYRSSLIKKDQPFYDETQLHEDTEKCMEILAHSDFGFVHQVLSFSRADNESISSRVRDLQPISIDRYIVIRRYASQFLSADEAVALKKRTRREYYKVLAAEALHARQEHFWKYHREGLATIGERLSISLLVARILSHLLWMIINPGETIAKVLRFVKSENSAGSAASEKLKPESQNAVSGRQVSEPARQD